VAAGPTIDDKAVRIAQDLDGGLFLEWISAADQIVPVAGPVFLVLVAVAWIWRRLVPSSVRSPL
jgi:hypothetical protein